MDRVISFFVATKILNLCTPIIAYCEISSQENLGFYVLSAIIIIAVYINVLRYTYHTGTYLSGLAAVYINVLRYTYHTGTYLSGLAAPCLTNYNHHTITLH